MPIPLVISDRVDIPAGETVNVLTSFSQALLKEASRIQIFLNRESISIKAQAKIGDTEVFPLGGMAVNPTLGDVPIIPGDVVVNSAGMPAEEIEINATNTNVAPQEIGFTVKIVSVEDAIVDPSLVALS